MSSSWTSSEGVAGTAAAAAAKSGRGPEFASIAGTGPEVAAEDLFVGYGRRRRAALGLRGLSARFGPGITALVGPNGAGKSTLLRAVCGLLPPSDGCLTVGGADPSAFVTARGVGFLPENPPLPEHLTPREFLMGVASGALSADEGVGDLHGIPGFGSILDKRIETLSLGQRKKVALAAALCRSPGLLLLDEPTNGLDPLAVQDLREVLTRLGREGMTVIVSSHHLDELQRLADILVFVDGGTCVGRWTRREALEQYQSFDALFEDVFRGRDA
jgi:ABC-type multidrug transport system ATPase subunit